MYWVVDVDLRRGGDPVDRIPPKEPRNQVGGYVMNDSIRFFARGVLVLGMAMMIPASAYAWEQWSTDTTDNCVTCHGDFRAASYISLVDGMDWGNLHNLHRSTMLSGDCDACHQSGSLFPTFIGDSAGGDGLSSIGCMGCHGREEDNTAANPDFPNGRGAGLRQHHFNAGVTGCENCHDDSNPATYTTVGENVLPDYYANPGTGHAAMPTDPCTASGSENFAGAPFGIDNDGDLDYEMSDTDCTTPVEGSTWGHVKALYR